MEQSLEQALITGAHQTIDQTAQLIVERGLPFNVSITFSWGDGAFVSQSISIRDGSIETDATTDEDVPEINEAYLEEVFDRIITRRTSPVGGYFFGGHHYLVTREGMWDEMTTVERRLTNQIIALEQRIEAFEQLDSDDTGNEIEEPRLPWWKRMWL